MPNPNEVQLTIVVNGQPFKIDANVNEPLRVPIEHALQVSGNSGQPLSNWELRDSGGQVLDPTRKVGDFHFPAGINLFLSLKAGIGG